jgi:hypothetical protein
LLCSPSHELTVCVCRFEEVEGNSAALVSLTVVVNLGMVLLVQLRYSLRPPPLLSIDPSVRRPILAAPFSRRNNIGANLQVGHRLATAIQIGYLFREEFRSQGPKRRTVLQNQRRHRDPCLGRNDSIKLDRLVLRRTRKKQLDDSPRHPMI